MIAPHEAFWPLLLIPLSPFLAFWLITLGGGSAAVRRWAHVIAPAAVGGAFAAACVVFACGFQDARDASLRLDAEWFRIGDYPVRMGLQADHLSTALALMVGFISFWIFVYAGGYMEVGGAHEDPRQHRFFAYLSLFVASMFGCVLADNYLLLLTCWEGMGLCSYLLIGFWFAKPEAAAAAKKAFLTTRVGDVALMLGIILLLLLVGDSGFAHVFNAAQWPAPGQPALFALAGFLIFCGAVGKSAQFPLHVWLPDAMEGPTPVSALIHAATMVAAGVYLVARSYPLIAGTWVMPVVTAIGVITALLGALIAVAQNDIKRVLAYSTISQLGYMMFAVGVGSWFAAIFHLLTHAFFKALLFLGAGAVIHGYHHEQDMMRMGGGKLFMPRTFWPYFAGYLALTGVVFTSGFFSKDEIIAQALHSPYAWAGWAGLAAAFLTSFYMTRQMCLIFAGAPRGEHAPHEVGARLWLPLWVLLLPALLLGFLQSPLGHFLEDYIAPSAMTDHDMMTPGWSAVLLAALPAIVLNVLGIAVGWMLYGAKPLVAQQADPLMRLIGAPLYGFLQRRMLIDELYRATLVALLHLCARFSAWFDRVVVDGLVNGIGYLTYLAGQGLRRTQTGLAQTYMLVIVGGVVLLTMAQIFFRRMGF